ncbi:hypothetical protein [Natrinema versiforme]|uniref:hypothetical protein n=1 Tax=Natrinema versiforme TaxID=88724 RepID=UPI000677AD29|nr:hypothetical protein [Natrinema versiforme]
MSQTPVEAIDTMLASVQEEIDDSDLRFKLRTSRQLLRVLQERKKLEQDALAVDELDESTRENLERLGYLE